MTEKVQMNVKLCGLVSGKVQDPNRPAPLLPDPRYGASTAPTPYRK